jgi:hypothetical protein
MRGPGKSLRAKKYRAKKYTVTYSREKEKLLIRPRKALFTSKKSVVKSIQFLRFINIHLSLSFVSDSCCSPVAFLFLFASGILVSDYYSAHLARFQKNT